MPTFSLRLRVLLIAALTIVATLTIAGISLVLVFERHIERRLEQELGTRLTEVLAALSLDSQGQPTVGPLADPLYGKPLSGAYWQVMEKGQPVVRSRSLWDTVLPFDPTSVASGEAVERTGSNNETLYVLEREVSLGGGSPPRRFLVMVAFDHAELYALRDAFSSDVRMVLGLIALVLVGGAWFQSGFGLRPLRALRAQLDSLRKGDRRRIEGRFPQEVSPVVDDLNQLLLEQEQALDKARQRAGTLAHGLKTPLAILTGEANRLNRSGRLDEAAVIMRQVRDMEHHVERELARARAAPLVAGHGQRCDAREIAGRLVDMMKRVPSDRAIDWRIDVDPILLDIDAHDLGEILGNLLDNSRKWAARLVTVSAHLSGAVARVSVEDDGPGVPADKRASATERGWRGREDAKGSGLGLAIASDVLAEYGSSLEIEERGGGGSRFSFQLPGIASNTATPTRALGTLRAAE